MLEVKAIIKEFIQYSIGIMFLWLLSGAYKIMREVREGRKDPNKRNSKDKQRRVSKVDNRKLPTKHRNSTGIHESNQELHQNDAIKKGAKKMKRKKPHTLEFSYGCWAVLFFPISLAILSAFVPLDQYFLILDEVWMRQTVHKFKIVFHEIVYRDPLSHYDWTSPNITRNQEPIDKTSHLTSLNPKAIEIDQRNVVPEEILKKKSRSKMRVYVLDDLLTKSECDKLCWIHNSHVWSMSTYDPILCFDSEKTMEDYMLYLPRKKTRNSLIPGTLCINATIPGLAGKTVYTSEFFKGESEFSLDLADRVQSALGLPRSHGQSFTVTSLPIKPDPKILKNQKGCAEESQSGQLRRSFASVLVFLSGVAKEGHISFKDLGIKIEAKKGRAIAWTTQSEEGNCDKDSTYDITQIQNGVLYTLQQWFYPHQFEGIGQRPTVLEVPFRKPSQPYMFCDAIKCQWFDNWNHFINTSW